MYNFQSRDLNVFVPSINQGPITTRRPESRRLNVDNLVDRKHQRNNERRRRPDRRRQQIPLTMEDRRRQNDRRQPKLLNAKSALPEKISSQKGRTIDTKV